VAAVPVVAAVGRRRRLGALCVLGGSPRALGPAEQQTLAEFGCLAADVVEGGRAGGHAVRDPFEGHGARMLLVDPRSGDIVEASAAAFYGRTG
jgi:hypothetical protein